MMKFVLNMMHQMQTSRGQLEACGGGWYGHGRLGGPAERCDLRSISPYFWLISAVFRAFSERFWSDCWRFRAERCGGRAEAGGDWGKQNDAFCTEKRRILCWKWWIFHWSCWWILQNRLRRSPRRRARVMKFALKWWILYLKRWSLHLKWWISR